MGTAVGREADALALLAELAGAPHEHDLLHTLRRIEGLYTDRPRLGLSGQRKYEPPIRFGQEPHVEMAPADVAGFDRHQEGRLPRLLVRSFGLLGPNGPMPLSFTEEVKDRRDNGHDPTLARFLDVFHHRLLTLFYRAWAAAQPEVHRDRPDGDEFSGYVGAFVGLDAEMLRDGDRLPVEAKLFHAGTLSRHVRNADGLQAILSDYFAVTVVVEQWVGHWMTIEPGERMHLGRAVAHLGEGAVLGDRVWDRQHKFRLHMGPLTREQYESFLLGGSALQELVDWVRLYVGFELAWDVRLILKSGAVPQLELGRGMRLGWTSWLGKRERATDADDLCFDAERFIQREGVVAA